MPTQNCNQFERLVYIRSARSGRTQLAKWMTQACEADEPTRKQQPSPRSDYPSKPTTQPAERLPLEANDPARGAGDSIEPGAPAPGSRLEKRLSPRSGRQRKASTRCRPLRGLEHICWFVILGLAPQALCCHLLRRLKTANICFAG